MSFLGFDGKTILVFGVANKKSVAYQIGQVLEAEGATVVYVVRSKERKDSVAKLLPKAESHVCDVARDEEILAVARDITNGHPTIHGLVHSIAFLDYEGGNRPFHETARKAFLQSVDISCYSLATRSSPSRTPSKITSHLRRQLSRSPSPRPSWRRRTTASWAQ